MKIQQETIDQIKARIPPRKLAGILGITVDKGMMICPYHPDTRPSMSCGHEFVFKCFACGKSRDVILFHCEHRGLKFPDAVRELAAYAGIDLPTHERAKAKAKPDMRKFATIEEARRFHAGWSSFDLKAEHHWDNDDEAPNKHVFRLQPKNPEERKQLPTIYFHRGHWQNKKPGGHPLPRPYLWGACKEAQEVFLFEGESDTEAAQGLGLAATTTGGSTSWDKEFARYFTGRDVIIVPDCDEPGRKYAEAAAADIRTLCRSLRIVDLGGERGHDFRDFLKAGGSLESFRQRVDAAPDIRTVWNPPRASWDGFERIPNFDPDEMLHWPIRYWIEYLAADLQAPMDALAAAVITGLSAVLGAKICLRPKIHSDTWRTYSNLWFLLVAPPGDKKTAILKAALRMVFTLDRELGMQNVLDAANRDAEETTLKLEKREIESQISKLIKEGGDVRFLQEQLAKKTARLSQLSQIGDRCLIVGDTTPEKLTELLINNPHGLVQFNDEFGGFYRKLSKGVHTDTRSVYLESWGGGEIKVQRKKGSMAGWSILSFVSSTQPDWFKTIVDEVVGGTDQNDGLIARFGLMIAHDRPIGTFKWHDAPYHPQAREIFDEVFRRLWELKVPEDRKVLHFDQEAQEFVARWMEDHHNSWHESKEKSALRSHMYKQTSLFCSLSIIFHMLFCFENGEILDESSTFSQEISIHSARMAAAWCRYIGSHVRKVYEPKDGYWDPVVRSFAAQVLNGRLTSGMTRSEILACRFQHLKNAKDLDRALSHLGRLNLVQEVEVSEGSQRPRRIIELNPLPFKEKQDGVVKN